MHSLFHRFNPLKEIIGCLLWALFIYFFFANEGLVRSKEFIGDLKECIIGSDH